MNEHRKTTIRKCFILKLLRKLVFFHLIKADFFDGNLAGNGSSFYISSEIKKKNS